MQRKIVEYNEYNQEGERAGNRIRVYYKDGICKTEANEIVVKNGNFRVTRSISTGWKKQLRYTNQRIVTKPLSIAEIAEVTKLATEVKTVIDGETIEGGEIKTQKKRGRVKQSTEGFKELGDELIASGLPLREFLKTKDMLKRYPALYIHFKKEGILEKVPKGKKGKPANPNKVVKVKDPNAPKGQAGRKSSMTDEFIKGVMDGVKTSNLSLREYLATQNQSDSYAKIYQAIRRQKAPDQLTA